ncbi:phosphatase PAP2 family protein [Flavitalea flava]
MQLNKAAKFIILLILKPGSAKNILNILVILISSRSVFCQSFDSSTGIRPYHVNRFTTGGIIAAGLGTDYFAIARIKDKSQISEVELQNLSTVEINPIDRWALHQNTSNYKTYKKISDAIQAPLYIILPALLGLDKKIRKDWLDILFMYIEGHTITFTFYNYSWLGPTFQNKYRPLTYYSGLPLADRENGGNRNSFYSGHVASTAFTTFFIAKVYCDYHPEIGAGKYLVYSAALIPPAIMGYLRVRSLAHFPSDDLVGLTLGAAIGIVLPELHKFKNKGITLGLLCTPDALGFTLCWKLPAGSSL